MRWRVAVSDFWWDIGSTRWRREEYCVAVWELGTAASPKLLRPRNKWPADGIRLFLGVFQWLVDGIRLFDDDFWQVTQQQFSHITPSHRSSRWRMKCFAHFDHFRIWCRLTFSVNVYESMERPGSIVARSRGWGIIGPETHSILYIISSSYGRGEYNQLYTGIYVIYTSSYIL